MAKAAFGSWSAGMLLVLVASSCGAARGRDPAGGTGGGEPEGGAGGAATGGSGGAGGSGGSATGGTGGEGRGGSGGQSTTPDAGAPADARAPGQDGGVTIGPSGFK